VSSYIILRLLVCLLTSLHSFGVFFNHIDHYPANTFLYLTSGGIAASQVTDGATKSKKGETSEEALAGIESEPEEDASGAEGG
jgi:tRNA pseudouridine38-40 synthase